MNGPSGVGRASCTSVGSAGLDVSQARDLANDSFVTRPGGRFKLFEKANEASGHRGLRTQPLGSFQSGDKVLGKQNYDVRFNLHVCKELILSWGRNAYTSDDDKGRPIDVSWQGQTLVVHCHVDITTPRDNMLWHGIEGPHVVIERYRIQGDVNPRRVYKARSPVFELTPNDVFMLNVWERDNNQGQSMKDPGRTWPQWFLQRLGSHCMLAL